MNGCPVYSGLMSLQHVVQHNTCQNNVSDNRLAYSVVPSSTVYMLSRIPNASTTTPPASGDPEACYCLFPSELAAVVGFHLS